MEAHVAGYTITITPNDDEAGPQTTIRVDTGSGSARITELTVRAVEGGGLSPQQLPAVNLEQLIAALAPPAPAAIAATPLPTEESPEPVETAAPDVSAQPSTPSEPTESSASSGRSGRAGRAKKAGRKAPAKKAPSRTRQAKAEKVSAAQPASGRRAYRRMPEPNDVLSAYREVGGTTALARHFNVPRHTATGWLRRLRSQGLLES
jgi:hypothetical protein